MRCHYLEGEVEFAVSAFEIGLIGRGQIDAAHDGRAFEDVGLELEDGVHRNGDLLVEIGVRIVGHARVHAHHQVLIHPMPLGQRRAHSHVRVVKLAIVAHGGLCVCVVVVVVLLLLGFVC